MNRILELRQDRAAKIDLAGKILSKAADEKRALTTEEEAQYGTIFADAEAVRKTIEAEERQANLTASIKDVREQQKEVTGLGVDQQRELNSAALRGFLQTGEVAPEHRSIMFPARQQEGNFRATQQTSLTGATGGYTVPQGFWAQVVAAMKFYGGIRASRAKVISTDMGNALPIPTSDDTGNTGELLSENTQATSLAVPFGSVTLNAYKWSSKIILIPIELLQDSGVDIEAFLVSRLAERIGRVQNTYFTTGTGSSQPGGVVTGAASGKVGLTGQTASLIYNDLVDLKYAVNRSYRANAEFMMHDTTLSTILKIVDGNSRPLFESVLQVSLKTGEPDMLLGAPVIINNDMATMAANAKSVLYGDFSNFWVRDVKAMMLLRLVERYADYGQVGFIGFARSDAKMVDAGQNPVKYYANSAS